MKNITFQILAMCIIILFIINNLYAQENRVLMNHSREFDSYQFPRLPMVQGKMSPGPYNVIQQDFSLTLRDNVILDCSKFFPDTGNIFLPNGYPGVIMCHGYGDSKATLAQFAHDQASYGYSVYTYSMRGEGNSGGLSNLISITEAQDLMEVVNYVKHDQGSRVDSSNILIMGGSQGGIIPYMAACNGMNVKCIISALASPTFASSWIENGSIKMTLLWTVSYPPSNARYTPQVDAIRSWIYSGSVDKWDSLAYWLPLNRDFANQVPQNKIPIMLENSWQDYFFNAYGNISTIPILTSPKRYYFGAVQGHGGDTSGTENLWHMNFFNEWFYYWLFNINNNILTRPLFHYASTTFPTNSVNMWSFIHDSSSVWPPNGQTDLKLFFNWDNILRITQNANQNKFQNLKNHVSSKLTMQQAVDWEFKGGKFTTAFWKDYIIFNTPKLANDIRIIGTPQMKFDYASSAGRVQFNFQISEVNVPDSPNVVKLVSRVNYSDRHNTPNIRKNVPFYGNSFSHIFKKGDKIRITITNIDNKEISDTSFLGSNPFVLPVLDSGSSKIYYSNNSYIILPVQVLNSSPGGMKIFEDENSEPVQADNIPFNFDLKQNYPNPFNPSTTIEYAVPENSFVTLKIYNVSGKEVASLVNSQLSAGNYSVLLNADLYHLSSGIYFYKLTAGNQVAVKKLMLIK